jgi:hypothetical protein
MAKKETKRPPPAAWRPCKDCATPEACESLKTLWGNRAEVCDIIKARPDPSSKDRNRLILAPPAGPDWKPCADCKTPADCERWRRGIDLKADHF